MLWSMPTEVIGYAMLGTKLIKTELVGFIELFYIHDFSTIL